MSRLTTQIRTRLTADFSGAFCPLSLDGRQPACASQAKNPSQNSHCEGQSSSDGAGFRQGKESAAENTCRIVKALDADTAERCPSKPDPYPRHQPKDVIIACDFPSAAQTLAFLDRFAGEKPFVKIGMELFYAEGPQIVRSLKARGHRIFLDLKLHDIPNTVKKAMRVLSALDADLVNLHAAGGKAMMEAALEGLTRPDGSRPLLIAVTQLTSTDRNVLERELLIREPLEDVVLSYARLAASAGLDGVVCSPLEAGRIHEGCGAGFLTVTPGVRFAEGDAGDQKRIATPAKARELGSDYIVVGRPITGAEDPVAAWQRCRKEFLG